MTTCFTALLPFVRGHSAPAKLVASPLKFSETPATYRRPPPQLGEHTEEVLKNAGFSAEEVESLQKTGALVKNAHPRLCLYLL